MQREKEMEGKQRICPTVFQLLLLWIMMVCRLSTVTHETVCNNQHGRMLLYHLWAPAGTEQGALAPLEML